MRFIRGKDLVGKDVAVCLESIVYVSERTGDDRAPYVAVYVDGGHILYLARPFDKFMDQLYIWVKL